jgi:uncharacterized protein involved in outer membrane biogenesis
MNASLAVRRTLIGTAGTLAVLIVLAAALAVAVDAGRFRGPMIRYIAARTGRQISVGGAFEAHVLSFHPRVIAEHVAIGNPPWTPSGPTAEIGRLSMTIELPGFGRSLGIEKLAMEAVTLHLVRDTAGHANWQWTNPDEGGGPALPLVRSLSMPNVHVDLDDARRHLQFHGIVSAQDVNGSGAARLLHIEGVGQLNGKAATFAVNADPLADASHARPYRFTFDERSSGSRLSGRGSLPRPFDFDILETTFDASGADLKDLYFLTGVSLVNTGRYHLAGKLARRGTHSTFSDLVVTSGETDMNGTVSIETSSGRPKLDAELDSRRLRLADLGARAAGRDAEDAASAPLLISNAMLNPGATRRGEALVNFHARRVDVGRVPLLRVAARMTIDHGILVVAPLSADVYDGKLTAHARLDATTDDPAADVDLKLGDLQLGQFLEKGSAQPPVDGRLRARVIVKGHGSSLHQVAATANGTVTAVLSHGAIRTSLAELTGIDFRGLGLLLAKSTQEADVRCAVAGFRAHDGILTAQSVVIDTEPVLITGTGDIHLDSEALDLVLRGHPKGLRLARLRSPLLVRGTLLRPSTGIQAGSTAAQTVEAVALGIVLTPLASVLAFVDPGLAKDADCATLVAAAKALDTRVPATPAAPPH